MHMFYSSYYFKWNHIIFKITAEIEIHPLETTNDHMVAVVLQLPLEALLEIKKESGEKFID